MALLFSRVRKNSSLVIFSLQWMFIYSSQPTKLDAHVVRAIDLTHSIRTQYRLSSKWYQAVQLRPLEEQNLWTTPMKNNSSSPSSRKVRIEHNRYRHVLTIESP